MFIGAPTLGTDVTSGNSGVPWLEATMVSSIVEGAIVESAETLVLPRVVGWDVVEISEEEMPECLLRLEVKFRSV